MDASSRKHPRSTKRVPLAETSSNVPPLHKKQRVPPRPEAKKDSLPVTKDSAPKDFATKDSEQPVPTPANALVSASTGSSTTGANPTATAPAKVTKSARLVGEELRSWQTSWRKIMRESVVYFDTQGCDSTSQTQHSEQKRAMRALRLVGCDIASFYDREVSIIVSRRPFSASKTYPANDIFNDAATLKIKVWDFDKVFRFLKNLGFSENSAAQERSGNLSHLLKEEKIFGSTDRDPNTRRDDLHYLEKNFVYVYDLSQAVRPIAVREWLSDNYPAFHLTMDGKCPFIADISDNLERKKLRRIQKFDATKEYRHLLKKVSDEIISVARGTHPPTTNDQSSFSQTATSTDQNEPNDNSAVTTTCLSLDDNIDLQNAEAVFKPPIGLSRQSSIMHPTHQSFGISVSTSKMYDVAASGYNGASNAMSMSMDSSLNSGTLQHQGNGLGPTVSQVPSKNLNDLKKRIFMKRQLQRPESNGKEKEKKPGYCENCRVKYDNFDEHIISNRHRNFACEDSNFKDIDDLIETLGESKLLGCITSNGDYRVSM